MIYAVQAVAAARPFLAGQSKAHRLTGNAHRWKIVADRAVTYRQDSHDLNTSIAGIRIRLLPIRFRLLLLCLWLVL